jgi:hypothetical protein
MRAWLRRLVACSFLFGLLSCGETQEYLNCRDVCQKRQECIAGDVDVGRCAARCEDRSDQDPSYAQRISRCEACIEDRSCVEALTCWNECL